MLRHRGYVGHADLDVDAGVLHGEILGIRDVVTFEGTSVDELQKAFEDSVDDYLENVRGAWRRAEQALLRQDPS